MVRPINYKLDVSDPMEDALQGYKAGVSITQIAEQKEQNERKLARQLAMRDELAKIAMKSEKSPSDFTNLAIKYPEMTDRFKKIYDMQNEQQKQSSINKLTQVYSALSSGNKDVAENLLQEEKQAAENAGLTDEAQKADIMLKQIKMNANAAKTSIAYALSSVMEPKQFENILKIDAPTKKFRSLTELEKKNLGLDPKKAYQLGTDGKITSIGGGGVQVNIGDKGKFGTIPAGWMIKEDANGAYTMEPIPGGPVEKKSKELAKKQIGSKELKERATNIVISDITRLKDKIEDAPWYSPVAGVLASKILPGLRQNRVDALQLKQTIVGNIGFDRLQQMRETSPTGGALGAISDRELATLQAVLGSLELSQSEDQLISNLDRLETQYNAILEKASAYPNAVEFGFAKSTPKTQPLEAKGRTKDGRIKLSDGRIVSAAEAKKLLGL